MGIFKAYDIRGVYPAELNEDTAEGIGKAIGTIAKGRTVFVNRDGRKSSKAIESRFINAILSCGADVGYLGMGPVMIPAVVSFNEKQYGVSITASHNSAEYAGIIFLLDGVTFDPELIKKVFDSQAFSTGSGRLRNLDYNEKYSELATSGVSGTGFKIGIDTMGGMAAVFAEDICRRIGSEPVFLKEGVSEDFFGKEPEPTKEHGAGLSKLVVDKKLDFGVQLDGDADRLGVFDERGEFVEPVVVGIIIAKYNHFDSVIADVTCSRIVEKYAKVHYCRVGHRFIEEMIAQGEHDFAMESSAHFYFGKYYPFSDGLLTMVMLAKALKESGRKLSELVDEIGRPNYFTYRIRINDPEARKAAADKAVAKAGSMGKVDYTDGCKVIFDDGFVLIRESNTESIIKIYCDGNSKEALERMIRISKELLDVT